MAGLRSRIKSFDRRVDAALDRIRTPTTDRIFYTASELGDFSLIWHLTATAAALRRDQPASAAIRAWALMGLESALVNGPVKSVFRRKRPVYEGPRPRRLRQPRTSSFPSGHASAAMTFVCITDPADPIRPAIVVVAGVVATSRIYVRIHHASDVVAGVVVGAALGTAFRRWWPPGATVPPSLARRPGVGSDS